MSKKKLARIIAVCIIAINIVALIIIVPPRIPPSHGLKFHGTDDYVDFGNDKSLDIIGAITIEAWVKDIQNQEWSLIVGRSHSTDYHVDYGILVCNDGTNQRYRFQVTDSDGKQWETAVYLAGMDSKWHHVAGTFDGKYLRFYFDGKLYHTLEKRGASTLATSGHSLVIGDWFGHKLDAMVSEVRIWNVARSGVEIRANMSKELKGTEIGLIGYWKLDEGSGSMAYDSAGSNNGLLMGDPEWFIGGD